MKSASLYPSRPVWLNKKIDLKSCHEVSSLLRGLSLNTVCQSALCPNIGECFTKKHATFLILGKNCTRNCRFCGVSKNKPEAIDLEESKRVAEAASRLGLKHVVITSVTRDDLEDGGALVFSESVKEVRKCLPAANIEVLIPDFKGEKKALEIVVKSFPDIIAHNVETVPSLYQEVRNNALYLRSLSVLKSSKEINANIFTKSGIMLGLGEREDEVLEVFADLVKVGCDFLSIGQYLAPSKEHYPVKEYIALEKFEELRKIALKQGFRFVVSGPYVRSSYQASEYIS